MKINIEDLERWTGRVYEAIAVGSVVNVGNQEKKTFQNIFCPSCRYEPIS